VPDSLDLWVAAGLLIVVVIVYVGNKVGVLPNKSIPVVAGAVFGALGFMWFASWRRKATDAQVRELKRRIEERDAALEDLRRRRGVAEEELAAARTALNNQKAAAEKALAEIDKRLDAEVAGIDTAGAVTTATEYARQLREEREYRERLRVRGGGTP